MAEQKKEFFWKYESVVDSPYAGCRDIVSMFSGFTAFTKKNCDNPAFQAK